MTRGIAFCIDTSPCHGNNNMDADTINENPKLLGISYAENAPTERVKNELQRFKKALIGAGFCVEPDPWAEDEIAEGTTPAAFIINAIDADKLAQAKQAWFASRYETVKELMARMTPETFAINNDLIVKIRNHMEDNFSDMVCLDNGGGPRIYNLDRFIRTMEPNKLYFICDQAIILYA